MCQRVAILRCDSSRSRSNCRNAVRVLQINGDAAGEISSRCYRFLQGDGRDAVEGILSLLPPRWQKRLGTPRNRGDSPLETVVKRLFAHCCWLARLFSARSSRSTRLRSTPITLRTLRLCVRNELPLSHIRGRIWYNVCE